MKEYVAEHWLTVAVTVYLLAMVLYGHHRGFIRIAASMIALVVSSIVVQAGMPYVTGFLKENTAIHEMIADSMLNMSGFEAENEEAAEAGETTLANQRQIIEEMNLPEPLKKALIDNNNSEMRQILGVGAFSEYIGNYLSNLLFDMIGFLVLFLISYIIIRILLGRLNLFARLPIISGMNQIAGAIVGGLEALALLWLLGLLVTVCAGTGWGHTVILQIEASPWLSFLYRNNIFQWIVMGVLSSMFRGT